MPGVLIVEALAQTGAVAILSQENFKEGPLILADKQRKIQTQSSSR